MVWQAREYLQSVIKKDVEIQGFRATVDVNWMMTRIHLLQSVCVSFDSVLRRMYPTKWRLSEKALKDPKAMQYLFKKLLRPAQKFLGIESLSKGQGVSA